MRRPMNTIFTRRRLMNKLNVFLQNADDETSITKDNKSLICGDQTDDDLLNPDKSNKASINRTDSKLNEELNNEANSDCTEELKNYTYEWINGAWHNYVGSHMDYSGYIE